MSLDELTIKKENGKPVSKGEILDLFDNVKDMSYMFNGCSSLKSLNLSSFNTNNVKDMEYLLVCCSSLKLLDLSLFNESNIIDIKSDLSNYGGNFISFKPYIENNNLHNSLLTITENSTYRFYSLTDIGNCIDSDSRVKVILLIRKEIIYMKEKQKIVFLLPIIFI